MSFRKSKSSKSYSSPSTDASKAFSLGKNRFVSISEFRGQTRVDIREFYNDDSGEQRPGKKGISLSMEEWNKLKSYLPKIEKAIKGINDSDSDNDSDHKKKIKKHSSESDSDDEPKKSSNAAKKSKKADSDSDQDSEPPKKSKKTLSSDSESD